MSNMTDLPLKESFPRSSCSGKDEEPSCSYATARSSETSSDVKIKLKINDLNQTFVRIINSLKIMNVQNRNSGRENINSNNEMPSLFQDFLNISHLLNVKINYLYNTYAPRSEIKKYISPINYKLYVFNINSFELCQEIDKGNRRHKKYQILHDLNISEMTNNVKLFNFVDDVKMEEPTSSKQDGKDERTENTKDEQDTKMMEGTCTNLDFMQTCEPFRTDEACANKDDVDTHLTKKLKTKPESHCMGDVTSLEVNESTAQVESSTKKLGTTEENSDVNDSVNVNNNLFKEINNDILTLSKEIDELNLLLKTLIQRQDISPGCSSNEDNSDEEREEVKKQSTEDNRIKKWQMKQMTRALIDNMVNSIQEEYHRTNEARHQLTLVNEAVLMAIQSFGLQQQREEESSRDTAGSSSSAGVGCDNGADGASSAAGGSIDPPAGTSSLAVGSIDPPAGTSSLAVGSNNSAGALGSRKRHRCDVLPPGALVSRSIIENVVGPLRGEINMLEDNRPLLRPTRTALLPAGSSTSPSEGQTDSSCRRLNLNKVAKRKSRDKTDSNEDDSLDERDDSLDELDRLSRSDEKEDLRHGSCEVNVASESSSSGQSLSNPMTSSIDESVDVTSSSDNFYDDDFLAQAVTVAISKKGLST